MLMREYVELFEGFLEVKSEENESYTKKFGTEITLNFPTHVPQL
jgi:hypothetical protein